MADNDDTIPGARGLRHVPPIKAVYQALGEARINCDLMDAAVQRDCVDVAVVAADHACRSLLQARAALQRFNKDTLRDEAALAQVATAAAHREIIDRFTRVVLRVQSPQLRRELLRLRLGLALASGGEPPPSH